MASHPEAGLFELSGAVAAATRRALAVLTLVLLLPEGFELLVVDLAAEPFLRPALDVGLERVQSGEHAAAAHALVAVLLEGLPPGSQEDVLGRDAALGLGREPALPAAALLGASFL